MLTPQKPIGSNFGAATTADEVIANIDLAGKVAIVTGGYSGLGRETARVLRRAGARVIVPARDVTRANAALAGIDVEVAPMNLLDPSSIDAFAASFLESTRALHILVDSAAIMAVPELTRDARGYESQFATNHLGHFQLALRLLPALRRANGARVVSVSSLGHRYSPVFLDDPHYDQRPYDPWTGYGQSKTANILFAVALDEREKRHGIRAFSLHPGAIVDTGLGKYVPREQLVAAGVLDGQGKPILDPARQLKTVEQGAATQVWCATNPQLNGRGGVYCENVDVAPLMVTQPTITGMSDAMRLTGVAPYAVDRVNAEGLWQLSEKLLGIRAA
ncbi:SDR family NAD(P)-dependent oxidoreductase [Burkholderia sp. IDO3]|uniref:SDR family NAD(P)-dependent oxidoreductase n=1 Tax=Burkholderia sp. IDO3 TaxID=1705310 RepID=UPI000BBB2EA7|nr:SDR family NAD(P)-dependent oxidoreductase [Burkholderia sp. IDO3]AXK67241.1 SDR family NAD(P)-dependent oxidoreductase [Burkholderia sp. IDO3]PCD56937.1 oxidoreductase [Burkholderia sp. IDO3]